MTVTVPLAYLSDLDMDSIDENVVDNTAPDISTSDDEAPVNTNRAPRASARAATRISITDIKADTSGLSHSPDINVGNIMSLEATMLSTEPVTMCSISDLPSAKSRTMLLEWSEICDDDDVVRLVEHTNDVAVSSTPALTSTDNGNTGCGNGAILGSALTNFDTNHINVLMAVKQRRIEVCFVMSAILLF